MGCSFPIPAEAGSDLTLDYVGRRVGILLAANIAGSTIGAFVTGWIFLDWLGTAGTLRLLVVLSGIVAAAAAWWWNCTAGRLRVFAYGAFVIVATGVAAVVPGSRSLWATLHGSQPNNVIMAEDALWARAAEGRKAFSFRRTDISACRRVRQRPRTELASVVAGFTPCSVPCRRSFIHILVRRPSSVSGPVTRSTGMAGRKEIEQIVSIEIIRPQLAALRELSQQYNYPGLLPVLDRTRVHHMFGDGAPVPEPQHSDVRHHRG